MLYCHNECRTCITLFGLAAQAAATRSTCLEYHLSDVASAMRQLASQ